jgi:protein-disulfide isomerase
MNRRFFILSSGMALAATLPRLSATAADTPKPSSNPYGIRALGQASAPIQVMEFYSLTCPHCAEFETATLPSVKKQFIDTGKLRLIFRDFPLDGVALMATQVARSLPASEYYPFVSALFASQDKWAFAPGEHTEAQYKQAIFRYAALAGMSKADFDAALANDKLKQFILAERTKAEQKYHVDATPTFIMNGKKHAGAMDIKEFSNYIGQA